VWLEADETDVQRLVLRDACPVDERETSGFPQPRVEGGREN
jgi:hypothetical protein